MQRNENKSIDARAFPQIWASLSQGETTLFRDRIRHETNVSYQTVWNWATGKKIPLFAHQRAIVSILARMGYKTTTRTLFPE